MAKRQESQDQTFPARTGNEPAGSTDTTDLLRLAKYLADHPGPLPAHFTSDQRRVVLVEIGRLRRARFITYLAGAIARDIGRSGDT